MIIRVSVAIWMVFLFFPQLESFADVGLTLNLHYNDPRYPEEGGSWSVRVLSTSGESISYARIAIGNVDTPGTRDLTDRSDRFGEFGVRTQLNVTDHSDGVFEIEWGQDFEDPQLDVGLGFKDSRDSLANPHWNGSTRLFGGTFSGDRPVFDPVETSLKSEIRVFNTNATSETIAPFAIIDGVTTPTVRGDSLASLQLESPNGAGLVLGDSDRNGRVDAADLERISIGFGTKLDSPFGYYTANGWDSGDFDGSRLIDAPDFSVVWGNLGKSSIPPSGTATTKVIPEPTAMFLTLLGSLLLFVSNHSIRPQSHLVPRLLPAELGDEH